MNLNDLIERHNVDESAVEREREVNAAQRREYQLREIRKQFGLNQTELSRLVNVSQQRISRIERGDISSVQVDSLRRYASAIGGTLNISIDTHDGQHFDLSDSGDLVSH